MEMNACDIADVGSQKAFVARQFFETENGLSPGDVVFVNSSPLHTVIICFAYMLCTVIFILIYSLYVMYSYIYSDYYRIRNLGIVSYIHVPRQRFNNYIFYCMHFINILSTARLRNRCDHFDTVYKLFNFYKFCLQL